MARAWTVRGGQSGEREQAALSEGRAIVGWEDLGDLSDCASADEIGELLAKGYPEEAVGTIDNWKRQLWRFIAMDIGDYVVMPRKQMPVVALGRVTGPYEYVPESAWLQAHPHGRVGAPPRGTGGHPR